MSALDQAGVKIRPVMEIKDREAAREAVIRGLGIGVVSESEFASHERLKTLRYPMPGCTYMLMSRDRRLPNLMP